MQPIQLFRAKSSVYDLVEAVKEYGFAAVLENEEAAMPLCDAAEKILRDRGARTAQTFVRGDDFAYVVYDLDRYGDGSQALIDQVVQLL